MAKSSNGIDITIFSACKVSEKSGIPVLFLANPGVGKSTGVEFFAKVRGYELILLRGNTETNESIMGYSVCPPDAKENSSVIQLRPAWFQQLLDNKEDGKRSLLFLDEITTANEYTQAALLHLIFERKCGTESIPEDTLIVAAGNYANNLSNSMVMLPPLLTRFMIINLTPTYDDLDDFLSKYDGSIAGSRTDHFKKLMDDMKKIDAQELTDISREQIDKIGEHIERNIRLVTKMLMTTESKPISLQVTELQNVYSDLDNDQPLANVVNLRTLNYFRDVTVAEYLCFGKSGITSSIYKNMVNGLVGLGVSRDTKGEVKYTSVTNEYFNSMSGVIGDIEKMNNSKLPKYEKFFTEITNKSDKSQYSSAELNTVTNKLREMLGDKEINGVERPIDSEVVQKLCEFLTVSAKTVNKLKFSGTGKISESIAVEKLNDVVVYWNLVAETMTEVNNLVLNSSRKYGDQVKTVVSDTNTSLRHCAFRVKTLRKALILEDAAFEKIVPEIKSTKS